MRLLLTNDDGIESEGLKYLVDWARNIGDVTVFAPKTQQSAKSQSIQIHGAYEVKKVDLFGGIEAYSVDSTPADCVRVAVLGMKKQFDIAISGINNGPNLGADIRYSGTVAACFEASQFGIKALAFSTAFHAFENANKNLDRVFREIQTRGLLGQADVLNVNFPAQGDGILLTKMGPAIYSDTFDFLPDDMVAPCLISLYNGTRNLELDTDATMTGHISITPLQRGMTDEAAYERLRRLF